MSLQYYRFFPGDYARDTRHLSMMQQGAYRQLIDEYMVHGPLPNDLQRLYRICSAFNAEERASVEYVLTEFFLLDGPSWRHKRCDREIEWQHSKSASASESAKHGWDSRRNASAMRTHSRRNANQNQNQNQNHKPEPKPEASRPLPSWLDLEAWSQYLEHRRAKRAPLTRRAVELLLKKLEAFKSRGHDPKLVLEQSIENGWTGVFELKGERGEEWWASEEATKAKGAEVGIYPRPGETWTQFRSRIKACLAT